MTTALAPKKRAGRRSQRRKTITAFDLFAGIGGFRAGGLAAKKVQVTFAGSCENDVHSARTYRAMFDPRSEAHVEDLCSLTRRPGEGAIKSFLKSAARSQKIRDNLPAFTLLTAGFPCQPHSLMGNRQGVNDDRGSLFFDIAEVLKAVSPPHFILENVRAIKSVNDGRLYADMLRVLQDDLGYNLRVWELNAADYGAPQTRRRVFFVGSHGPLPTVPPPTVSPQIRPYPSVWHLLERSVPEKYYLSERILLTILKDQHKGYRRKAEINRLIGRPLTRTMHKMHRASQDNYYSDAFINGQFDAATGSVSFAPHGEDRIRRITPREAFRIQTFPEELIERAVASGTSDTQLYMQAGNAVPPALVTAVIDHAFGSFNA